ncbi:MAG: hypothetical protein B7Z61_14255, partial [Acidobacteria bacterium 37-71-11]
VASPDNLGRWDEIQAGLAQLGDPRSLAPAKAAELIRDLPAVVWIQCSVHGDEASGADAGLALAYHLASGSGPEVGRILANTVVVVDPVQNPDGRARFVESNRQGRGPSPDPEPVSAEHVQPWPGGRVSHDLFDLNRDWFALTQPESAARVAAMLRYHPTVTADLHEMGAEEGYYFAPPAVPRHPLLEGEGDALLDLLGRGNAAAFDAHGFRYWRPRQRRRLRRPRFSLLDPGGVRRVLPRLRRLVAGAHRRGRDDVRAGLEPGPGDAPEGREQAHLRRRRDAPPARGVHHVPHDGRQPGALPARLVRVPADRRGGGGARPGASLRARRRGGSCRGGRARRAARPAGDRGVPRDLRQG